MIAPGSEPPRLAGWLLRLLSRNEDRLPLEGDFDEEFDWRRRTRGAARARAWYWGQLAKSGPALINDAVYWRTTMLRNDLKTAFRNIMKSKVTSLINVAGLAIGLACFLAIFLYVRFERSYDDYHGDGDRIYRVATAISSLNMPGDKNRFAKISAPAAPAIKENFPQVEKAARLRFTPRVLIRYKDKLSYESDFVSADQELFEIFSIPVVQGAADISGPGTVVLTESTALKYFGREEPLGKTISIDDSDFKVTGIVKDAPRNTHVKYRLIAPLRLSDYERESWRQTQFYTYLKVNRTADVGELEKSINAVLKNSPGKLRADWTYFLQPLRDIHLRSDLLYEIAPPGNPAYLYIFSVIAVFVLLIAAVNFVNLSTARSSSRAKEVGLRKVIGALRGQLFRQFLCESLVLSGAAAAIAFCLVCLLLPRLGDWTGIAFHLADVLDIRVMAGVLAVVSLVGLVSGFYPALFLSRFSPILTLKGNAKTGASKTALRKSLVIVQFAIAVIMIISTRLVHSQLDFMKKADLGFDKNQKLVVPARLSKDDYQSIKNEFLAHPSIQGATASSTVPGRENQTCGIGLKGNEFAGVVFNSTTVDYDFQREYGLEVVAGEAFTKENSFDAARICLINETGAKLLGFDLPEKAIGKALQWAKGEILILGVLKDFHYRGLQQKIDPLVLVLPEADPQLFTLTLTVKTDGLSETLKFIEGRWNALHLGAVFSYRFLDADFDRLYRTEERIGRIFGTFAALGLFIAFLGMFGLTFLMSEQRTREIGIRKVLGATAASIVVLLTKEFVKLVILGVLIAAPIAYSAMDRWLQSFAYRTSIGWTPFAGAAVAVVALSLLTVSFQVLKSASANPAKSIRFE